MPEARALYAAGVAAEARTRIRSPGNHPENFAVFSGTGNVVRVPGAQESNVPETHAQNTVRVPGTQDPSAMYRQPAQNMMRVQGTQEPSVVSRSPTQSAVRAPSAQGLRVRSGIPVRSIVGQQGNQPITLLSDSAGVSESERQGLATSASQPMTQRSKEPELPGNQEYLNPPTSMMLRRMNNTGRTQYRMDTQHNRRGKNLREVIRFIMERTTALKQGYQHRIQDSIL